MTDLKPCPFCGKDAMVVRNAFDNCDIYHIECTGCLAEHARYMGSREAAIEEWNRRAERTCREATIDKFFRGCSECGYMWEYMYGIGSRTRPNYCPNCGAKVANDD